jgi:hypothetical protein
MLQFERNERDEIKKDKKNHKLIFVINTNLFIHHQTCRYRLVMFDIKLCQTFYYKNQWSRCGSEVIR